MLLVLFHPFGRSCRIHLFVATLFAPLLHYSLGDTVGETGQLLEPAQVVSWGEGGELATRIPSHWLQFRKPVGTVCLTGDDRIGKSTLLTLWARSLTRAEGFGFSIGHKRTSHTQGLWSAVLPAEATGLDYHLNLCDSQGLKQLAEKEQWRLFSANVLIPSVVVYLVINVVQNDQLRDLARMAHQFQQLSTDELGAFGRLLSPHLVVVIREESDLDGEQQQDGRDLSWHLEEALSGPAFAEDKKLIRQVFQTREAWSLHELPLEARRALRDPTTASSLLGPEDGGHKEVVPGGEGWRASGQAVLQRVLAILNGKQGEFPQGGPELSEWYKSVVKTVNSLEQRSMGRLIGHTERLAVWQQRRNFLSEWRRPVFLVLLGLALLLMLGGWLGKWLDRAAWCTWIVVCVCYVGTSPLVTVPLNSVVPTSCEGVTAATNNPLLRLACREASTQTAAFLLAMILGVLSYPMLTAQLRWLLGRFPLPSWLRQSCSGFGLAGVIAVLGLIQDEGLGIVVGDSAWSFATPTILALAAALAGAELVLKLRHNRNCVRASEKGLGLHFYIAARSEEVQALMRTAEWTNHYRRSTAQDALWRYRRLPVWQSAAMCLQACSLLAWAWLVCPHCDGVLMIGALANLLHILWRLCMAIVRCARRRRGPVAAWFQALEEAGGDSDVASNSEEDVDSAVTESIPATAFQDQVTDATLGEPAPELTGTEESAPQPSVRSRGGRTSSPGKRMPPQPVAETGDEQVQRLRIEDMRRAQERLSFAGS